MANDALISALRQVAMFDGLKPLHITEIARRADRIVYKPGTRIMTADEPADAAVIIVSGHAERLSGPGPGHAAQPLPPGTILAEMAMLIDTTPASTVVAVSDVRALRLAREEMHRLIAEDPAISDHFIAKAAGRLQTIANEMRRIEADLSRILDADLGASRPTPQATQSSRPQALGPASLH